uniref:Uncharacterized protein n=1 Tax=Populus trichocarpa TaxID=3694 RepID=A0A2K1R650_POPTR
MVRSSMTDGGRKASIKESSFACNSVFSMMESTSLKSNNKQSRRFLLSCASTTSLTSYISLSFSILRLSPMRFKFFNSLRLAALLSFAPPPQTVNPSNGRRHVILSIPFGMKATPEPSIRRCLNLISFPIALGNSLRESHQVT